MTTPEGVVKSDVKKLLAKYNIWPASKAGTFPEEAAGWYYLPVSSGHGVHGIPDFIGHFHGVFFGIETKAPGKKASGFQLLQMNSIRATGGKVFEIDGDLSELEEWLNDKIRHKYIAAEMVKAYLKNEEED